MNETVIQMNLVNYIKTAAEDYNTASPACDKGYRGILVNNPNDPLDAAYTDHNEWFTWVVDKEKGLLEVGIGTYKQEEGPELNNEIMEAAFAFEKKAGLAYAGVCDVDNTYWSDRTHFTFYFILPEGV